jgi:hypothetical protein
MHPTSSLYVAACRSAVDRHRSRRDGARGRRRPRAALAAVEDALAEHDPYVDEELGILGG